MAGNPFASAFENGHEAGGGASGGLSAAHIWAPSQIGAYDDAEDEERLLGSGDYEGGAFGADFGGKSGAPHAPVGWDPSAAPERFDSGPPLPPGCCERVLSIVLCCGEVALYRRLAQDVVDPQARACVRRSFWLHWASLFALALNALLFLLLLLTRRESLMELVWALVYLLVLPPVEWLMFPRLVLGSLRTAQAAPQLGLLKCSAALLGLLHCYLLLAPKWSGASGLLMLIDLIGSPSPAWAIVFSVIFTAAQGCLLTFGAIVFAHALGLARDQSALDL
jgi:hypothetical protein